MFDQATAAVIAALIGFLGGLVAARASYQQKSDELFFKALDFLGGGAQKRNLGISAIELYWKNSRHRPLCVSLLAGSAVYLLLESGQDDAAHEIHNLHRIMTLLLETDSHDQRTAKSLLAVHHAVQTALPGNRATGLKVPKNELQAWETKLKGMVNG